MYGTRARRGDRRRRRRSPGVLAPALDRPQTAPVWTDRGDALLTVIDDDRRGVLLRIALADGAITRVVDGQRSVVESVHPEGEEAASRSSAMRRRRVRCSRSTPRAGASSRIENDAWRATVRTASTESFESRSRDGTMVRGLLARALGTEPGRPHRSHGALDPRRAGGAG